MMEQEERIMTIIHEKKGEGGDQLAASIDEPDGWIS